MLKCERERVSFLPLARTIVYPINEDSPMFGLTEEDFEKSDVEVPVIISAMEETFAQTIHARSSYKLKEIKFGCKFANLYNEIETGEPISVDIKKLSETEENNVYGNYRRVRQNFKF